MYGKSKENTGYNGKKAQADKYEEKLKIKDPFQDVVKVFADP